MTDRFSDSQMLKLVEAYQKYPCLWNVSSDLYKNREARESAYMEIWKKLKIPGLIITDIPKKIKNMRSSYCQELKRIAKSVRSGADQDSVYKPKVSWFTTADGFLKTFRNKQESFSYIDEKSNTTSENESETQNTEDSFIEDNCVYVQVNAADDANNEDENNDSNLNESSTSNFMAPKMKRFKKTSKIINNKQDDIYSAIDKLDKIAKNMTNTTNTLVENCKKEYEFDVFAKYIAVTLQSLPAELAIVAKTDIQKALSDVQLKALRQTTQAPLSYVDVASTSSACKRRKRRSLSPASGSSDSDDELIPHNIKKESH